MKVLKYIKELILELLGVIGLAIGVVGGAIGSAWLFGFGMILSSIWLGRYIFVKEG